MLRSPNCCYQKGCASCIRAGKPCNSMTCKSVLWLLIHDFFLLSGAGDELDKMRAQLDVDLELSRNHLDKAMGTLQTVLLEAVSALSQWQKIESAKIRLVQHIEDMIDFILEDLYNESGGLSVSVVAGL